MSRNPFAAALRHYRNKAHVRRNRVHEMRELDEALAEYAERGDG